MTRVGFLGFGEAGSAIAGGLTDAGFSSIAAFDIAWRSVPLVSERADTLNVELVTSPRALAERSDTIISAVTCAEAATASESISDHLDDLHLYLDINSVAPGVKIGIAEQFAERRLRYVDVAVMGNVSRDLAEVPMLLAGPDAGEVPRRLAPAPLKTTIVSNQVGDAAQLKMFRSLFIKGLEALALEGMMASYAAGSHEEVLASLEKTFDTYTFSGFIRHLIERHAVHGRRRAEEMQHVATSLREVGVEPIMAEASIARMSWDVDRGFQEQFEKRTDPDWQSVLKGLTELKRQGDPDLA